MLRGFRLPRRWATVGLLAGLGWFAPGALPAQQPPAHFPPAVTPEAVAPRPALPITSAPAAGPPVPTTVLPGEVLTAQPPAPPAEEKPKGPESPWAKVPNLSPAPRTGFFLLPPTGAGYYTALDWFEGRSRDKIPPTPYRTLLGSFFDNDFRYLDKPDGKPVDIFDDLKRIPLGSTDDPWCHPIELSIGGEFRYQLKNEVGGPNGRLTTRDNRYDLIRTRVYGDLWYKDVFRVYVEFLDAQSFNQDLPPLPIDVNHSDLLNAFFDLKIAEIQGRPVYARAGRQELTYGSQRLVSPLDWANTRRTFEGGKVFWHGEKLDLDGFWVRPVLTYPGRFDSAEANRQFAGTWLTYRPVATQALDAYYLYLDSDLPVAFGRSPGGRAGFDVNTFGARWSGNEKASTLLPGLQGRTLAGDLLWDFEGSYQFGDYSNRSVNAGFATAGLGYRFEKLPWQPQFWAYFDYASGTPGRNDPNISFETFNQLFPFGHFYLGFLDEVGRENIHDWNFQASVYPTKWITALMQYHVFRLDQARDALYGAPSGYVPVRFDPTGRAGTNVGQELDFVASFQLDRHSNVLVGYSKFFSGDFIRQTGPNVNPELFYVQYAFRW